jgi:hypothetical protein
MLAAVEADLPEEADKPVVSRYNRSELDKIDVRTSS